MNRIIVSCVIGFLMGVGCSIAKADMIVVAGWDFEGLSSSGPSPFAPSSSSSAVSVVGLTRGGGVGTGGAGNAWGGTGWATSNIADAILAQDFVTFSVTPNSGATLSLSSIALYRTSRSGTGPTSGQWQYQLDSGGFHNIGAAVDWGSSSGGNTANRTSIDLSTISDLENVFEQQVTMRLINWGATSDSGSWYFTDNTTGNNSEAPLDLVILGSVTAVPEPASLLLVGIAAAAGLAGQRWRRRTPRAGVAAHQ